MAAGAPALSSPGTKDSMLSSVKSANAIRTTPITSRLICEEGEAAPRASPRLAEVVTAMIAMLAQGFGHFKQMEGMEPDDLLCSRNARSRKDGKGVARCPSCSQNAHDRNVLAWASDASRRVEGGRVRRSRRKGQPCPLP